jgi:pteridine reductase
MPLPAYEKVALVTGAGRRRVGQAVARALAGRGYAIAIHYHRSAAEAQEAMISLKEEGAHVQVFQADLTCPAEVERLFGEVQEQFGRLDVLVTAAALWEPRPLESITADDVRRHFEINVLGTFLCCQQAGKLMVAQPAGGTIVTIGDWAVARPYLDYGAYFISKGAIPTMTRMLAVELAHRNPAVRVNCIQPGPVLIPGGVSEAERQRAIAGTLVRREGRPENVAQAVLFLVENDFVTGVTVPVDGGRTIAGGQLDLCEDGGPGI